MKVMVFTDDHRWDEEEKDTMEIQRYYGMRLNVDRDEYIWYEKGFIVVSRIKRWVWYFCV